MYSIVVELESKHRIVEYSIVDYLRNMSIVRLRMNWGDSVGDS